MILALFIVSIASVSASDVSDMNDDQDYISVDDESVDDNLLGLYGSDSDLTEVSEADSGSDSGDEGSGDSVPDSGEGDSTGSNPGTTNIVSSITTVVNGDDYSVTLMDGDGIPLSGKDLIFTFNGDDYTRTTNADGVASFTINAKPSDYLISVLFAGDGSYGSSSISNTITVSKTPTTIANATVSAINGKSYSVVLKDKNGNPLSNKIVIIRFNGKTYNVTTNSKGIASFTINGTVAKTYTLTCKFAGDGYYAASSLSKSLKVKMPTTVTGSSSIIVKGNKFSVTLKNANGYALSNRTITFNFSGRIYNKTTNSKGVASLTIGATPGKYYNLTYGFAGTSYYGESSKKVTLFVKTPTQFTNSGSSVGKGKTYYLTLKDYNGNVLSNKTVKLTFNGRIYNKTTNSKGIVGLKISATIGRTYTMGYEFAGDSNYGPSSGSANIRIKNATSLTGSGSYIIRGNAYKVTLKDDDGNVLAGQRITFTFNGKVYNRTTNSKGVANLTISASAGKTYKFSYVFPGTSYYNQSSSGTIDLAVKVKSSFKNSGSVIMNNTTYIVTLRDSEGNLLANKLVNFTFDGKTYQNKTDANGTVGLLINVTTPKIAKLTYKFEGDNKYDASSGSVSLDVKSDKIFTFKHIVNAAVWLRAYVEKYAKLPKNISVNGVYINMTSFAYLMAQNVVHINKNKTYNVGVVNVSSNYTNGGNSSINAALNKDQYLNLTQRLINFVLSDEHRLPTFLTTNIGKVSPNLYIFGLAKILDFYSNNGRLPNYVTLNAKDVSGGANVTKKGNLSQYKKGLNEVQKLNSTQLAQYLVSSGNDALNSAIRQLANNLTAGKTTVWAKAEAIFNWVRDNINYEFYADTRYKATGTLSKKKGNCCDHANLIVALCRAADIPARYSHGRNCYFSSGLGPTGHVWAQIYIDGVWYSADATSRYNKLGNIHNWNTNSFTLKGQYVHLAF